jgi:hypothetical protein
MAYKKKEKGKKRSPRSPFLEKKEVLFPTH